MKKIRLTAFVVIFLAGIALFSPQFSSAFSATFVDPSYQASQFLSLSFQISSIAFDSSMNLYTEKSGNFGTGTANILELTAPGYSTSSPFASYSTSEYGINGLSFAGGILYASEFHSSGSGLDSGSITQINSSTGAFISTADLSSFRPTGITNDSSGNIFFPGRKWSDTNFGNIYESSNGGTTSNPIVSNFVGTGIAYYSGSIFVSNTTGDIYRIDLNTLTQTKIATFDKTIEELTFDKYGNLYVVDVASVGQGSTIIELARVPEPATMLLLGLGLVGLVGVRRKFLK